MTTHKQQTLTTLRHLQIRAPRTLNLELYTMNLLFIKKPAI
jgi:hypothetical protein